MKDNKVLYCIDGNENQSTRLEFWGEDGDDNMQRIDFNLYNCIEDLENNVCVGKNFAETANYLEPSELVIYTNIESFDHLKYGSLKKRKESKVLTQQFSLKEALYMDSYIKITSLEDEIDYLQIG